MIESLTIDPGTLARTELRDRLCRYLLAQQCLTWLEGEPITRRVAILTPTWKHAVDRHVVHLAHQFPGRYDGRNHRYELDLPGGGEIWNITADSLEKWMSMNFMAIGIDESDAEIEDPEVLDWANRRVRNLAARHSRGMLYHLKGSEITEREVR